MAEEGASVISSTKQEIVTAIQAFVLAVGGPYNAWYVGITKDARARLAQHGVRESVDKSIAKKASSSAVAGEVEEYFVKMLGTRGGPGGGDTAADVVYAYKISSRTIP